MKNKEKILKKMRGEGKTSLSIEKQKQEYTYFSPEIDKIFKFFKKTIANLEFYIQ